VIRSTSIEAYNTIKDNGLLSKRRWEVYDWLFHNGPSYANKVWREINPHANNGVVTTRFSELKAMGLVREVGETIDERSGMACILWDVTADLPRKISKVINPTRNDIINELSELIEIALPFSKNPVWQSRAKAILISASKYRKRKTS
jgi:hypothetical protein